MKNRFFLIFSFLLLPVLAIAQNPPVDNASPSGSTAGIALPHNYNSGGNSQPQYYNYTRSWAPVTPTTSTAPPTNFSTHVLSTTWYNGFGQPLQSSTQLARDIVTLNDNRAMLEKPSYLPYVANGSGVNFQQTGFADQKSWYNTAYPAEGDNAYSRVKAVANGSEHSAVSYAPGKSLTGSDRGTTVSAEVNTTARPIRLLKNGTVGTSCEYVRFYTSGELVVTKTEGQHEAFSYEYHNRNGQLVCKQVDAGAGLLTTYYVYDDLGRITWIITPKAVEALEAANWSGSLDAVFEGLCHRYTYNKYGQLIERRIPDKDGLELTVYDAKHRPVLQQTPLLKNKGQWAFQLYDSRGRVVLSGLVNSADDRATWQAIADGSNVPPLIETNGLIDLILHECNGPQPEAMTGCVIHQHNYYDNYRFDPSLPFSGRTFSSTPGDYISLANTVIPVPYSFVQGQLTATRTRVTSPGNPFPGEWTSTVYFYDAKGRPIQTQTQYPWSNQAWDIATIQYTFTGAVFRTILYHQALPGSLKTGTTKMMVTRTYEQGQLGRLTSTALWLDGKLSNLASYSYDELGRLKEKSIGGIEKQKYTYNIRGQLTGINPDYVFTRTYPDATFGAKISYDYGFVESRYDGAIAGMVWRGAGSKANIRAYGYLYDRVGRMSSADFNKREDGLAQQGTPLWSKNEEDFSVSNLTYDANGNIQSMNQRGMANTGSGIAKVDMDRLNYYYLPNSNKLESVEDDIDPAINEPYGLNDFINRNQGSRNWDYQYDADGNLTMDRNKRIDNISYNHQDLPEEVTTNGNGHVVNIYDAAGTLLQKTVTKGFTSKVYRYAGPFVYEDNQPSYVLHEEGRARWIQDSLGWRNDYFIKDHLGNVRTVITKDQVGRFDYLATHEAPNISNEKQVFDINADPGNKPASNDPNDVTAIDLNGAVSGKQLGTSLMLKVMAGDKFKAEVSAYYDPDKDKETGEVITTEGMGNALIDALSGGITGIGSEAGVTGEVISSMFGSGEFVNSYGPLVNNNTDPSQPKAYLHYVLFDESLKVVGEQSGAIQVTADNAGQWRLLEMPEELEVQKNGFLVVFMGNMDTKWVSMDNLKVSYSRGRLLEEQHYYPHGMVASDGSQTSLKNRYLYQGKELQDEANLQLYDFHARQYDPQIGRFWGIDPADQFPSGYTGMGNDPGNSVDPDGMKATIVPYIGGNDEGHRQDNPQLTDHLGEEGIYGGMAGSVAAVDYAEFTNETRPVDIAHREAQKAWLTFQQSSGTWLTGTSKLVTGSYTDPSGNRYGVAQGEDGTISASIGEVTVSGKTDATIARESAEAAKYLPAQLVIDADIYASATITTTADINGVTGIPLKLAMPNGIQATASTDQGGHVDIIDPVNNSYINFKQGNVDVRVTPFSGLTRGDYNPGARALITLREFGPVKVQGDLGFDKKNLYLGARGALGTPTKIGPLTIPYSADVSAGFRFRFSIR